MFVDNLYLNWPAGNDDREKQSFFWFHDHRMDHTGSNVYKGMVGLYPIYDPKNDMDDGDETKGLRLPGVRTNHADGSFDVDYDIPLAFYDARLDDGTTDPQGHPRRRRASSRRPGTRASTRSGGARRSTSTSRTTASSATSSPSTAPRTRCWRSSGASTASGSWTRSIARIYEFKLMTSTAGPKAARDLGYATDGDLQGQWRIEDGQQCMKWTEIADDGGLLPFPIMRDSFELWPAKRREHSSTSPSTWTGRPPRRATSST